MQEEFNKPVKGECIGSYFDFYDRCFMYFWSVMLVILGLSTLFYLGQNPLKIILAFFVYIIFFFLFVLIYYRKLTRITASRSLFISENGLCLGKRKYEILGISNIYLQDDFINFNCQYKADAISLGKFKILESEFKFKIEKRFRQKPYALCEYLNNFCIDKINKIDNNF